jgi:hypothetical protein
VQILILDRFAFEPLSLLDLSDFVSLMRYLPKGFGEVTKFLCTEAGGAFLWRHNPDME